MKTEIELHLLANYPILYVLSAEEDRFVRDLESVCIKNRRKLWIHSISEGLWNIASVRGEPWFRTGAGRVNEGLRDPIAVLEHIKKAKPDDGVFVLLDFHETLRDALVKRLLKDLSHHLKHTRKNIIILSPFLELPRELEDLVVVLDFPLPDRGDLSGALENALQALKERKVRVDLSRGDKERLIAGGQGLTMEAFENCLAKAVVKNRKVHSGIIEEIVREKKQTLRKSGLLAFFGTRETMDRVGGLSILKTWLEKRQLAFTEKARVYGLPSPKGVLLLGVPGAGKSLTVKACAAHWRYPLLRLDMGALFSSRVGSSEGNARRAIQLAEAVAPCVLWIDEIEKAMAGVGSSSSSDAGTTARVLATFLTWMEEKTAPVFVIATANSVTNLPPEFTRRGRFDETFFIDLPGSEEREAIVRIHLEKRNRNPHDFDIPLLARNSPGYSGAEIEQAIISGLYDAFDEGRPLRTGDIIRNFKAQVPLSKTMEEEIQGLRTWARSRARWASRDMVEEEEGGPAKHGLRQV